MSFSRISLAWVVVALSCGALLELLDSSFVELSSVSEINALPLSSRFSVSGEVLSPHFSSGALVFDLSNRGVVTCYFRHPPSTLYLFSRDFVVVRGTVVQTSRGRLCVVERVDGFHVS